MAGEGDVYRSWAELNEVLDYAAIYPEPEDVFPGYSAAEKAMDMHRKETQAEPVDDSSESDDDEDMTGDELARVHEIMNLLAEEQAAED